MNKMKRNRTDKNNFINSMKSNRIDKNNFSNSMKKNGIGKRIISAVMSTVMIAASVPVFASAETPGDVTFATVSGLSYVREEDRGNYNDAFLLDAKANGLQYAQLDGILDASFATLKSKVESQGLKYVLVDGNLTYNGEYYNNVAVAEKLKALEAETGVQVIVCNGQKDIYNINASTFASGSRASATYTNPDQFRSIYSELGYDIASDKYKSSSSTSANLSYAVELEGGYRLIVIDASYYNTNGIMYGKGATTVSGMVSDDLLDWVKSECYIAKLQGQTPIGMCGWDITGSTLFGSSNLLINADEVANALADAGMHYIYTSASGKNDISAYVSDNGNMIYSVQTGSLLSFPNTMRISEFKQSIGTFDIVDADEAMNVKGYDGTVYEKPYRETSSLKIQYDNFDLAKYVSDIVRNYVGTVLIPGVTKNGTLEAFVKKQYGISLTDTINEKINGGLNIMGMIVFFDASNIMNMLEDMFGQAQTTLLKDPNTLADLCYKRMKTVADAKISSEPCTEFIDSYGFGSLEHGGTVNDLLLSMIVYSYYGNEDSSNDNFIKDVSENLQSGELVTFLAKLLGESIIRDLLFDDILSQIEMKPQYLLFLDDTEDSIGYYIQIGFKLYVSLHGENPSITGTLKSILADGYFKQYGKTIDEVLEYFINYYYSGDDREKLGKQLFAILESFVEDSDPVEKGDWNISYDGNESSASYASRENYRLPTMINVTLSDNASSEAYVTWYTKSTVTGSAIEIYNDKNSDFYGTHFIGVDGVSVSDSSSQTDRIYYLLDLGFASFGETKLSMTKHSLKIKGLEQGCTYYFKVGDSDKKWWSDTLTLTTADKSDDVTFIHVSDTAGNTKSDYSVFGNILGCAEYLYPDADFILHTGNFVEDSSDINQWQMFFDDNSKYFLSTPIVPVAGNGENLDSLQKNFTLGAIKDSSQTGAYYSFNYNNIHVAVLDSGAINSDGTLTEEQLKWFEKDMTSTNAKWKFVAIHNPVYTNGATSQNDTYKSYMKQLSGLMDTYGVDLVFAGEDCVYYRTDAMKAGAIANQPSVSYPYYDGSSVYYKTIVNPSGTVYTMIGSSGAEASDTHEINNVSKIFTESGKNVNPTLPMFTSVEIKENTLYLTSYTLDGQKATKVDSVSIKKGATLLGDADDDGRVTAADARFVLRAVSGLELATAEQKQRCDMNGDGKLSAADARTILRISAGLE